MLKTLANARQQGLISELELQFCFFLDELEKKASPELLLAAALCIRATRTGDVCLSLNDLAGTTIFAEDETGQEGLILPALPDWMESLRNSAVVGEPGEYKPFILDEGNRLYLYRYWDYERRLAENISRRLQLPLCSIEKDSFVEGLNRFFPGDHGPEVDWQKTAVAVALLKKFSIISGGPGTGKTFTVVKLLALLQETAAPNFLRIGLAAPTGKAAVRLSESIRSAKQYLSGAQEIMEHVPEDAKTIHRLLGAKKGKPSFHHDKDNQLHLDVLVIDEVSMADLALLCKLFEAFPDQGRLVLLGDKDQLASVEAGRVLGDICGEVERNRFSSPMANRIVRLYPGGIPAGSMEKEVPPLEDSMVLLEKSYRFEPTGAIGSLAKAIKKGDMQQVVSCFADGDKRNVRWHAGYDAESLKELASCVREGLQDYFQARDHQEAFAAFSHFRLLCVHRRGRYGVAAMNNWIEGLLEQAGLKARADTWYKGRPVLITKNDYVRDLYNGDIGITWNDGAGNLRVYFFLPDGLTRSFSPLRIPEHETSFALTVHKSQGSEFGRVALLLPENPSPLMTRELFYTAVTRARSSLEFWGDPKVLNYALLHLTKRNSGLHDLLWQSARKR